MRRPPIPNAPVREAQVARHLFKRAQLRFVKAVAARRVLIILAVSLALLAIAYVALYSYYPRPTHQTMLSRPTLAATTPVVAPIWRHP